MISFKQFNESKIAKLGGTSKVLELVYVDSSNISTLWQYSNKYLYTTQSGIWIFDNIPNYKLTREIRNWLKNQMCTYFLYDDHESLNYNLHEYCRMEDYHVVVEIDIEKLSEDSIIKELMEYLNINTDKAVLLYNELLTRQSLKESKIAKLGGFNDLLLLDTHKTHSYYSSAVWYYNKVYMYIIYGTQAPHIWFFNNIPDYSDIIQLKNWLKFKFAYNEKETVERNLHNYCNSSPDWNNEIDINGIDNKDFQNILKNELTVDLNKADYILNTIKSL